MAFVSPNAQSLIADLYPAAARGKSFGGTLMIVCLGKELGHSQAFPVSVVADCSNGLLLHDMVITHITCACLSLCAEQS